MRKHQLSHLLPFIKLFLVPLGLVWLASQFIEDLRLNSIKVDMFSLFAAFLVNQLALTFFALRMKMVLRVFGIRIPTIQSLRIHLQSMFYFFVLPMTIGLEAARFAKIKNVVGKQAKSVALGAALMADRLIGALAALLLAMILFPFMDFKFMAQLDLRLLLAIFAGGGVLISLLLLNERICASIKQVFSLIRLDSKELWMGMIVAMATHLLFAYGIFLASIGAHIQITFPQALFVISAAMLFVILPVSFAGLSPVEAASVGVLLGLGMPPEQAVAFALISYFAKLVAAFEGGAWEFYEGGENVFTRFSKMREEKFRKNT